MKSIVILHEGNEKNTHDNKLIRLLMEDLQLEINAVSFFGMGAKSNFFKAASYPEFLIEGVNKTIEKVLLIVDADDIKNDALYGGYENTEKSLNKIIAQLNFQEISSIYIMCDPTTKTGYLESFILSTIPAQQKTCIERFLECSQFKSKENHKAILNQIYNMAYPNAPYDFKHPYFDDLKTQLTQLFAESE